MKGRTFALLVERKDISQQTVQGTAPVLVNPPAQPQGERGDQGVEAVEFKAGMDGYGNGDLSKEDQRRSVEEESARGQREDRVRGGKASSKMGETPEQWNVPTLYNWNSGTNSIKGGRM
ncbi:unnamed protein product [Microthlaspi erraticum]|uniref:Uncharacterized protein n=1 Tax=Microthlaspi erraticum TaxID=1685480 RepID=A0A6D2KMJ7_9BRAS|nr:unnamed protein product [Microthlaspi erraticum]